MRCDILFGECMYNLIEDDNVMLKGRTTYCGVKLEPVWTFDKINTVISPAMAERSQISYFVSTACDFLRYAVI